jgi:hypothetical protein
MAFVKKKMLHSRGRLIQRIGSIFIDTFWATVVLSLHPKCGCRNQNADPAVIGFVGNWIL